MTYSSNCFVCETSFDWTSPVMTTADPACPTCGGPTSRQYHPVAAIWSKSLSSYGDRSKETFAKDDKAGGHWTFEKSSAEAVEKGRPIPVFLDSPQKQREYCKREGLVNPKDLPSNLTVAANGTSYEKNNVSEV